MCGNITKTIKNISRTHCNFLGIFARNFGMHRGSSITIRGVYSKKFQETEKKPKPAGKKPKPTHADGSGSPGRLRGVGLIRMPQP